MFLILASQLDIEDLGIDSESEDDDELEVRQIMETEESCSYSPYEPSTLISPELETRMEEELFELTKGSSPLKKFARNVLNSQEFDDRAIQDLTSQLVNNFPHVVRFIEIVTGANKPVEQRDYKLFHFQKSYTRKLVCGLSCLLKLRGTEESPISLMTSLLCIREGVSKVAMTLLNKLGVAYSFKQGLRFVKSLYIQTVKNLQNAFFNPLHLIAGPQPTAENVEEEIKSPTSPFPISL